MNTNGEQAELFGIIWRPFQRDSKLRANDIILIGGRLCLVIRVNECAAVILINRSARKFKTRWDREVQFQPPPATVRISPNSDVEILNGKAPEKRKPRRKSLRTTV